MKTRMQDDLCSCGLVDVKFFVNGAGLLAETKQIDLHYNHRHHQDEMQSCLPRQQYGQAMEAATGYALLDESLLRTLHHRPANLARPPHSTPLRWSVGCVDPRALVTTSGSTFASLAGAHSVNARRCLL